MKVEAKIYLTFYAFGLIITFGLLPHWDAFYNSRSTVHWLAPLFLFLVLPALLYLILKSYHVRLDRRLGIPALSILLLGPLFGYHLNRMKTAELQRNGTTTYGVVVEKRVASDGTSSIRVRYSTPKGDVLSFAVKDKRGIRDVGDSVKVIYSTRLPHLNDIVLD